MTATLITARDEIFAVFKAGWDATGFDAFYPDVKSQVPSGDTPWARVTLQHAVGGQATLAGETGSRRFRREGFLTVQVFTPKGEGMDRAYTLAQVVLDAFEGADTASGVWFRNCRTNEVPATGDWQQINVLVDFEYDEVK